MKQTELFDEFSYGKEFGSVNFGDERLNKRFVKVVERFAELPSAPINKACENWAETKSAYRLLDNDKVSVQEILVCHRDQTIQRAKGLEKLLVVQDTSLFNFHAHPKTKGLGSIGKNPGSQNSVRGLVVHTALALSEEGTPLGLIDQRVWSRAKEVDEFKGSEARKWLIALEQTASFAKQAKIQAITVCDREADITELMIQARQLGTDFVIRSRNTRAVHMASGKDNLEYFMFRQPTRGELEIEIVVRQTLLGDVWRKKRATGKKRKVQLEVRFAKVILQQSKNNFGIKARDESDLTFYAVHLSEKNPPPKANEISWLLLTTLPVETLDEALQVVEIYRKRWGIENYHKVLKSGCKIEESRLATAERLQRYITIMGIIGWRLYYLTRLNREMPDAPCTEVLTDMEWKALYCKIHHTKVLPKKPPSIKLATIWIAQLGGYLNRANDPPPGVQTMAGGWERLTEIAEMYELITCG